MHSDLVVEIPVHSDLVVEIPVHSDLVVEIPVHSDLVFLGYRNTNEKDHQGMTDQNLVIKSTVLYVLMQNCPPP